MVAVLAVVVNHVSASALPGGFVGVDVFFVISGFLITGRLLRTAHASSTKSYFGNFYKLRIRRLLPAAATTLLLTAVLARLVFYGERAKDVTTDAVWALFFGANWHFSNVGTNYFNHDQATSPVQHYWSLSVEEQFYVVWPIVVLLVGAWWVKRRPDRLFTAVRVAAATVVVASIAWGWHQTSVAPTHAYFSTFSRAWELGVGAFLATLPPPSRATSALWPSLASWAGLAIIGWAVVVTPDGNDFPVPWAIPAVIGSAVIIHAGRARQPANVILRGRLSVWLGDISYSIYLVHFPAWILLESLIHDRSAYLYCAVAGTTLAAAVVSYYFVEEPGRRGIATLIPRDERERHDLGIKLLVCTAAATVALGCITLRPSSPPPAFAALTDIVPSAAKTTDPSFVDPLPGVQHAIQKGINLTSWPKLTNSGSSAMVSGCNNLATLEKACRWEPSSANDAGKTVLLMGDSVMHSWLPMMRNAFTAEGWTVISIAQDDCFSAFAHYADTEQGGGKLAENKNCDAQHAFYADALKETEPDLVILDNMSDAIYKTSDGQGNLLPAVEQAAAYETGLKKTINLVKQAGAKALMLSATPDHKQIEDCRVGSAGPQNCVSRPSAHWQAIRKLDLQVSKETDVKYADIQNFFCFHGLCPPTVDGLKVVIDSHHITQEYAEYLAPSLEHYLSESGLLGSTKR